MRSPRDDSAATQAADYNARILHPLVEWLRAHRDDATLKSIAQTSELSLEQLDGKNHWIAMSQFERFIDEVRAIVPDDESFKQACVYRMAEGYGAIRYVLWAASPAAVYAASVRTYKLVSNIGKPSLLERSRNTLHIRIASDIKISRLNCILRQAQSAELPVLWGLPAASVRETACVAHGDASCDYHLRWFDRRSWVPSALGIALGIALGVMAARLGHGSVPITVLLAALGASIGWAFESQRTSRANIAVGQETNDALREMAEREVEATHELLALHERQRGWTRMLEDDAAERTKMIQGVVDRIEQSREARDRKLRGFSHDLNGPLTSLRIGTKHLAMSAHEMSEESAAIIPELETSIDRMQRLLQELMQVATAQAGFSQLAPETIEVAGLTERLRRRLRAMVYRRDIRVSAFRTREAPERIVADALLIDRITDNLLSNAAKYTERGSIVIEVDGRPDTLVLKISDSGRGFEAGQLERAFKPGGSEKSARTIGSHGLGLSIVVHLLVQIGGRLEVMSKPHVGTTFWVHLPTQAVPNVNLPAREQEPLEDLVNKVVTIRRNKSA